MRSHLGRLLISPSSPQVPQSGLKSPIHSQLRVWATAHCAAPISQRPYSQYWTHAEYKHWQRWKNKSVGIDQREHSRLSLEDEISAKLGVKTNSQSPEVESVENGNSIDKKWAELLAHHERLNGLGGIQTLWEARRARSYNLPTADTPEARFLWRTFSRHPDLVKDVIDHAVDLFRKNHEIYPRLYVLIMGYWLPRATKKAVNYHHQMLVKLRLRTLPLRSLIKLGPSGLDSAAYEGLLDVYRTSNERDVYDDVVLPLIADGNLSRARKWHNLCTSRGDHPSEASCEHPVVQVLIAQSSAMSSANPCSSKKGPMPGKNGDHKYNQDLVKRLLGRDTAPIRFDDAFTARMFATRTFSPDSVIRGLAMVGVNEIGPQSVLAMATHTEAIENLPGMFEELRSVGIALRGCVFSLALEKFAMEKRWPLVRSMLESDQHPDVFGDVDTQHKLLEFYLNEGDAMQAQRTLAILTLFHNDSNQEAWNLLLRMHIKISGPQHVTEVLHDMRAKDLIMSSETLAAIKGLLRPRQPGHKPVSSRAHSFDDTRFVTRAFMTILESGMAPILPTMWREIIRRYGMTGRLRELRRLLLWLLCWYAPRSSLQFSKLPRSPFLAKATHKLRTRLPSTPDYLRFRTTTTQNESESHPIRQIFSPSLIQGLIVWGFRAGSLPNATLEQSMLSDVLAKKHHRRRLLQDQHIQPADWSIGLRTVAQLRDLGVHVHQHTVVKTLQAQFINLFGRGRSNKIENQIMEEANTIPYEHYVREVNQIWGRQLFRESQSFERGKLENNAWHPRSQRVVDRPTSISIRDKLQQDRQSRNAGPFRPGAGSSSYDDCQDSLEALNLTFLKQEGDSDPDLGGNFVSDGVMYKTK